jgi:hypothetical protein
MLEALISISPDALGTDKRQGDIIVVKLAGSSWCEEEQRTLQLITFKDDALERDLVNQMLSGLSHVLAYPYADYSKGQRLKRSTVRIKINNLLNSIDIKNPRVRVSIKVPVDPTDIIMETPTRGSRVRKARGVL